MKEGMNEWFTLKSSGSSRSCSATAVEKERPALAISHLSTADNRAIVLISNNPTDISLRSMFTLSAALRPQRTRFEQLDGLRPLVLLAHLILLHHVVLDLLVALGQRFELQQDPLSEVGDARRARRLSVRQADVDHEDVREHAGGKKKKIFFC